MERKGKGTYDDETGDVLIDRQGEGEGRSLLDALVHGRETHDDLHDLMFARHVRRDQTLLLQEGKRRTKKSM